MGQISIRLDDKTEEKIKRESRENGKSLAEYCREKITGEQTEEINPIIIESKIKELENKIISLENNIEEMTAIIYKLGEHQNHVSEIITKKIKEIGNFIYYFVAVVGSKEQAEEIRIRVEKEKDWFLC